MSSDLSPVARRVVYALSFEGIGLAVSTAGLMLFSGTDALTASTASLGTMTIALIYNYVFNWAFETWERRQPIRGRPWRVRLIHGALFEFGLVVLMVPFLAWWMQIGLVEALVYDIGLVVFFAVYTLGFTLAFDKFFGLPQSAR